MSYHLILKIVHALCHCSLWASKPLPLSHWRQSRPACPPLQPKTCHPFKHCQLLCELLIWQFSDILKPSTLSKHLDYFFTCLIFLLLKWTLLWTKSLYFIHFWILYFLMVTESTQAIKKFKKKIILVLITDQ